MLMITAEGLLVRAQERATSQRAIITAIPSSYSSCLSGSRTAASCLSMQHAHDVRTMTICINANITHCEQPTLASDLSHCWTWLPGNSIAGCSGG